MQQELKSLEALQLCEARLTFAALLTEALAWPEEPDPEDIFACAPSETLRLDVLRTGRHQLRLDERASSVPGRAPEYESEWRQLFERFQFSLFMYGVGACVAMEVLAAAREVILVDRGMSTPNQALNLENR